MEQQNELKTWHDGDIIAGDAARQEDILKEVADSDLLLFFFLLIVLHLKAAKRN